MRGREEKRGEGKKKEGKWEEKYVLGREKKLKTFPSTLKNEVKGRKKGKGKKKDAQGREEHIFKGVGEGFQQCYALKPSPAP